MHNLSFILTDIAVDEMGNGATSGMDNFFGSSFLSYTNDVTDWYESTDIQFGFGQDMNSMGNGKFGFVGETGTYERSIVRVALIIDCIIPSCCLEFCRRIQQ